MLKPYTVFAALLGMVRPAIADAPARDRLPHDRAVEIVRRAIDDAGRDAWSRTRTVQFRKTTVRFKPDGSVERKRVQLHHYALRPVLQMRVEWEEDGKQIVLVHDGANAWKQVDGVLGQSEADTKQARNTTFGSHYVFSMPFKLADAGAHLEYAGEERLRDGNRVEKVRVTYERGIGDAGGEHVWTYYFDARTGRLCANHLNYAPGKYDYTEYLDDKNVDGLRLSTRRYGYNADAHGKIGPRISETVYEQISTNKELPPALFARGARR